MLKRAISDLKRRGGRWTSKCDNIRGTSIIVSLKRGENFVSKIPVGPKSINIVSALLNFQPVKRFQNRGDV